MAKDNSGFALVDGLINSKETYRHEVQEPNEMYTTGYRRFYNPRMQERMETDEKSYSSQKQVSVGTTWLNSFQSINSGIYSNGKLPGNLPIDGLGGHWIFPNIRYTVAGGNMRYSLIFHELAEGFLMNEGATSLLNISAKWPGLSGGLHMPEGIPLEYMIGGKNIDDVIKRGDYTWYSGSHNNANELEGHMWWLPSKIGRNEFWNPNPGGGGGNLIIPADLESTE